MDEKGSCLIPGSVDYILPQLSSNYDKPVLVERFISDDDIAMGLGDQITREDWSGRLNTLRVYRFAPQNNREAVVFLES